MPFGKSIFKIEITLLLFGSANFKFFPPMVLFRALRGAGPYCFSQITVTHRLATQRACCEQPEADCTQLPMEVNPIGEEFGASKKNRTFDNRVASGSLPSILLLTDALTNMGDRGLA